MSNSIPLPLCTRCDKEMEPGVIPDCGHLDAFREPVWVAGKPAVGWWGGLKLPDEKLPVRAYRCPQCGSLELFAKEKWQFPGG